MDGNFALRPEIYKALRQDRMIQAARERQASEASPPVTLQFLLAALWSRVDEVIEIIRTPRVPQEPKPGDRPIEPKPFLARLLCNV